MSNEPRATRPQPSIRPAQPIDRMQAAVLAAMRRQAVAERRVERGAATRVNGRSER
jgi:hypothetical protein